jgi:hypothetical protein
VTDPRTIYKNKEVVIEPRDELGRSSHPKVTE